MCSRQKTIGIKMKLVISEKNIAARRIAYILSGGKIKSLHYGKIPVYEFSKDDETWKIIGLKGHIINLDFPSGFNQWTKISPIDLIDGDLLADKLKELKLGLNIEIVEKVDIDEEWYKKI